MKKKLILILSLGLVLSACQNEDYQSQRHPEANDKSQVEANVKYTENKKSNDLSDAGLKKENSSEDKNSDEKNSSNLESNENNKENTENTEENTQPRQNTENVEGTYTVENITNIRENTSTDSDVVAQILPGNTVTRTEVNGEWSKVSFESYEGYILTELLVPAN